VSSANDEIEDSHSKIAWRKIAKIYEFIEGTQISNSFIVLKVLDESEVPLSSTQISERISSNINGKLFSFWSFKGHS
jgi:hypothetical protein